MGATEVEIDGKTYIRETNKDGKIICEYPKYRGSSTDPTKEAKKILESVKTEELDKTDLGLAVKALLTAQGLI